MPLVPDVDDPSEPTEWNPDPDAAGWTAEPRKLESACLDCLLHTPSPDRCTVHSHLMPPDSYTSNGMQKPYMDFLQDPKPSRPETKEGFYAAALLYVNNKKCAGIRIFAHPFPSKEDTRFPALYLDEDFLDRKNLEDDSEDDLEDDFGMDILRVFRKNLPASILGSLCRAMLKSPRQHEVVARNVERETFALLKILVKSDRPELALDLVYNVIVERTQDSSWHRYILTESLLKSLPPDRAKEFLNRLFTGIETNLQQQAEREMNKTDPMSESAKPVVKISTVKVLAQLMANADFVDEEHAIESLIELFTKSRHLDVRVAIVESLLSTLRSLKNENGKARIINALQTYAIPIASAVNEWNPMTEEDWTQAEAEGVVPEVYQPDSKSMQPVLAALHQSSRGLDDATARIILDRVLLPALKQSAENNRRWMMLFLRTNNFSVADENLLSLPVKPYFFSDFLTAHLGLIPTTIIELLAKITMINLDPPGDLATVSRTTMESVNLRASNAGKHWLALFHLEGERAILYGERTIGHILRKPFTPVVQDGIAHEKVMEVMMEQARTVILRGDENLKEQGLFFEELAPPFRGKKEVWRIWEKYSKRIVKLSITMIDGLRTQQWQRDQNRQPAALPDTYAMNLWLLTYPTLPWLPDHQDRLHLFASELFDQVTELEERYSKYHSKLQGIRNAALKAWPQDYCFIASKLGWLNPEVGPNRSLSQLLRVEIADILLQQAKRPKHASQANEARILLAKWRGSEVEEIRMRGLRTSRILSERGTGNVSAWFKD